MVLARVFGHQRMGRRGENWLEWEVMGAFSIMSQQDMQQRHADVQMEMELGDGIGHLELRGEWS